MKTNRQEKKALSKHLVQRVVDDGLCTGCGMCVASCSKGRIHLAYDRREDQFLPRLEGWTSADGDDPQLVCPGAGVDMNALSLQVHGRLPDDYSLGVYERIRVCHATDEPLRRAAASGGVVPTVLRRLFDQGRIDAAYCLVPGKGPYDAQGRILRSAEQLNQIHGSVYHPFDYGKELRRLVREETSRFAIVGLPCQIEGIEMIKARSPELARRHVLSIGLFCGGVNRFEGVAYYLNGFGVPWGRVEELTYRHGDWPGQIRLRDRLTGQEKVIPRIQGNNRWKILRYVAAFQGYWMLKRCRLCPDQVADFADIAVGDPHVPKYRRQKGPGFSIVISRTARGEAIMQELINKKDLIAEEADAELVRESQGYALDNRRHAPAYVRVARLLGQPVPELKVYPPINRHLSLRHHKWALVDLVKISLRRHKYLRPLYPFWQAFEYLFISFYPSLFFKRAGRLLLNRRK